MKKILFIFVCLISANVEAEKIICPQAVTCNYEQGVCDAVGWHAVPLVSSPDFPNGQPISSLSAITISKLSLQNYIISCEYKSVRLIRQVSGVSGSMWSFSGWGNASGVCVDITHPEECAAEY